LAGYPTLPAAAGEAAEASCRRIGLRARRRLLAVLPGCRPARLLADETGVGTVWGLIYFILLAGIGGLRYLSTSQARDDLQSLVPAYRLLFAGVFLTAFGSAWYHFAPGNDSMLWDRLPMTLVFASLLSIVIAEHVSLSIGRQILLPLLLTGVGSVVYWSVTESNGAGDLRPYMLVQFLPMLLIPLILLLFMSRYNRARVFWGMIVIYAAAKAVEELDSRIYMAGQLISGHSVKHLVAGLAPLLLLRELKAGSGKQPANARLGHEH